MLRPVTVEDELEDGSETESEAESENAASQEETPPVEVNPEPEETPLEDAIWSAYAESEWANSILAALNSGARTMKGFPLAESEARDNRIYF